MPEAQKNAIIRLARDVAEYYGITNIKGHREVGDTDCPGRNYRSMKYEMQFGKGGTGHAG